MKHILYLLISLYFIQAPAQSPQTEFTGRLLPSVNETTLRKAAFISDLTPQLWQRMILPDKERFELYRRSTDQYQGYNIYLLGYNYLSPEAWNYNRLIDYLRVEISVKHLGKTITAENTSDQLNDAQKKLLSLADLNTDITVRIKFRYKEYISDKPDKSFDINGEIAVTVVPDTEAAYPGGFSAFKNYLNKSVTSHVSGNNTTDKILRTVLDFTIDEQGRIVNSSVSGSSSDPQIDRLLLEALRNCPIWKPAKNSKGLPVQQQFRIFLGGDGC